MPTKTDFSVSPYFDDYNETNDYYKILFRPGVSVQARELNQLQTMLQRQVERFGDNIFKRGTIVDGCDITFHSTFPYVKIKDVSTDRTPINVGQFYGYYVRNQANVSPLVAAIQTVTSGFESRSPDLNTLYVRYLNSGFSNNGVTDVEESTFSANQILTVYNPRNVIESVTSLADSSGFSNNDTMVFLPALAVQNTTGGKTLPGGTFQVGNYITDGVANSIIVEIDTTSNTESTVLRIKPTPVDLRSGNADMWTFSVDTRVVSSSNSTTQANVVGIVGSGAAGILTTGSLGEVDHVSVTTKGSGYYVLPTVTIASTTADVGQIAAVNLEAQNYLTKITVANNSFSPIGNGYAVTVGQGVVYQKGYFSRVAEHLVVVEKYSGSPDAKSVGFDTAEEIINSNQDPTLLDNATNSPNETAPGANRLRLTPSLVVVTTSAAQSNNDFFPVVEFSGGLPYKQNRQTQYNIIGNEMARRSYEESGNYVLDPFIMNTKSANAYSDESTQFSIRIDPGLAYIGGKRVETLTNYDTTIRKGTDSVIATNATISMNFGSYIRIKEVGGTFIFKNGDMVSLYGAVTSLGARYISQYAGVTPSVSQIHIPADTPNSGLIGTARIRSIALEEGIPGTPEAVYRLYLFDIRTATARNFSVVKSVFYDGATKGIADVVLEGGECVLKDNITSTLLYYAGNDAVKNANNISYIYKTFDVNKTLTAATGTITFDVTSPQTFPYTGTLSTAQQGEVSIIPLANVRFANAIAGSVTTNPGTNQVNGTSTTFTSVLQAGDFLRIANSTVGAVVQVDNIANDTVLFLKSNSATSFATANATMYFPQYVPVSTKQRTTRTIAVDSEANTMTISLGAAVNATTTMAVSYNVRSGNTTPLAKTVNRNKFIRIRTANSSTSNTGPWPLGVSDAFRLRGVYKGSNSTFSDTDTGITEVTDQYYVDHNQTENYYNTSYLYRKPGSPSTLTTSDYLLVKFDYFTHEAAGGLKGPGGSGTYSINDNLPLVDSTATINTVEIPEVWGTRGQYYDLRDQFDLRPIALATVTPQAVASAAPVNPTEPTDSARFDNATDMKFPAPDSSMSASIEYYQGRQDRVVIEESGRFRIIEGEPGTYLAPIQPDNALTINLVKIPPYPSIPYSLSANMVLTIDTGIANEKYSTQRLNKYRVITPVSGVQRTVLQPRGYTMEAIGNLERRIADLEYYTSLTLVESQVKSRTIPSSTNSSVDRAKFGFFVDSFSDWTYADTSNPGYSASIIDGYLTTATSEFSITARPTQAYVSLPYIEVPLVSQSVSTNGPVYITPPAPVTTSEPSTTTDPAATSPVTPTPTVNNGSGTVTVNPPSNNTGGGSNTYVDVVSQTTTNVIQSNRHTSRSDSAPYVYEEFEYVFSATAGPSVLLMVARDNNMAIEIFQGITTGAYSTLVTSSGAAAITAVDVSTYQLNSLGETIEHQGLLLRKSSGPVGNWLEDQFKISWTHNPALGRYYKVRVYKGGNHGASGTKGTFKYKLYYPTDSVVSRSSNYSTTTNFNQMYSGLMQSQDEAALYMNVLMGVSGQPTAFTMPMTDNLSSTWRDLYAPAAATMSFPSGFSPSPYLLNEQALSVVIHGLKPNTTHTVVLDGETITTSTANRVKQVGKQIGDSLISDASGDMNLVIYIGTGINATTSVQQAAGAASLTANRKTVVVSNSDGTSQATGTFEIPSYVTNSTELSTQTVNLFSAISDAQLVEFFGNRTTFMDYY